MRWLPALLLVLGLAGGTFVPREALAQEEVCQPYDHARFRADLDAIYHRYFGASDDGGTR